MYSVIYIDYHFPKWYIYYNNSGDSAEVVELVDALVSGTSGRKLVGVQIPPSAPYTALLFYPTHHEILSIGFIHDKHKR